jgi:signal transduction histidine kinase
MVRPPTTIRAALLAGFLVILGVWLASAFYFTSYLASSQARNADTQTRFARGQELLFAVRSQVLLGSIYLRDALIEGNNLSAKETAVDQLRSFQRQVRQELDQYRAIDSVVDGADWARLEKELDDYWEAAVGLVAPESGKTIEVSQARLDAHVIPKRDVIAGLSDEIQKVMAEAFGREQAEFVEANRQVRRRIWETAAFAVVVGLCIAMVSMWYVGRLEATIHQETAEVARNRQELRHLSGRLVRAQEDERRTIARELHDEIGQALTAVDVELSVAERAITPDGRALSAIKEARMVTQRALAGARDLSQLLRPSMLDDFGLPDTLKWYLRKFSDRTGVRTELIEERLTERLPIDIEVCVYRAIQEAVTNVSRHARATTCHVFVQRLASSIVVTVEDDGVGLQAVESGNGARRDGLGLVGIRERVSDLGGAFRIEGRSGKGTRLTIELPLQTRAHYGDDGAHRSC